jgi:hypothetical protein
MRLMLALGSIKSADFHRPSLGWKFFIALPITHTKDLLGALTTGSPEKAEEGVCQGYGKSYRVEVETVPSLGEWDSSDRQNPALARTNVKALVCALTHS